MSNERMNILIVGGGFSGMTAALELAKVGAQITLLERDPDWRTDGAGISLHGATLRVFDRIGIYNKFLTVGGVSNGFDIFDSTDDSTILTLPTPVAAENLDYGGAGVMRPVLAELLREQVNKAAVDVRLGQSFAQISAEKDHVAVTFDDGRIDTFDLVIGADGVHSAVRKLIFNDAPTPELVGQGGWRAIVDWPDGLERPGMWKEGEYKVGINRISQTQGYVFATVSDDGSMTIDKSEYEERFASLLRRFTSPILNRIADNLDASSEILYKPLWNMLMPRPWSRGRVVLIGDAVHATTPHLAAGACIAMEDAVVLAREIDAHADWRDAVQAYEDKRWERCRMVVENSSRLCELEQTLGDPDEHAKIMKTSMAELATEI